MVFVHLHQARAVQARVSNVSTWIGDFGDRPRSHYILFRGCDVAKQERCDALFSHRARSQQVVMLSVRECLYLRPGLARHSRVVVHFEHPKNGQDAKTCFRILRFREIQILVEAEQFGLGSKWRIRCAPASG